MLRPYGVMGFGVLWYVLGALPSALLLAPDYISGSPRLMMFPSLGAGIFWGAALVQMWRSGQRGLPFSASRWTNILAVILAASGVVISVRFLMERRTEALVQSDYTWQLLRLLEQDQPTAPLVLNAPAFLAPTEGETARSSRALRVIFMVEYVNYNQQFWAMAGVEFPRVEALAYNPTLRPAAEVIYAPYQTVGQGTFEERLHAASAIYATEFVSGAFYPVYVGAPNLPGSDEPIAGFADGQLGLTEASAVYLPQAQMVTVTTRWRVNEPIAVKPFVHVLCDGQLVGQLDGAVWGGAYPFSLWAAGETQTDVRQIRLSQPVSAACLQVFAGAYWEADGVRLPVTDTTGERLPNDLVEIPVTDDE
ncbi:MAG: hypothetical protein U0694_04120 [Anaerolineae bacterium]